MGQVRRELQRLTTTAYHSAVLLCCVKVQPMRLSLRHTGLAPPDPNRQDYVIIDDGREVGRLYEDRSTLPELRWYWSVLVIGAHQAGIDTSGRAATMEAAKAAFQANYRRWLLWAKLEAET